jgi:hypothetical protein
MLILILLLLLYEHIEKIQKYNQETEKILYEFIHRFILLIPRLIVTFIQVIIIFNLIFFIFFINF